MADKNYDFKILGENRQAGHNYFLLDKYEAGLVLTGTEVKAARAGKIQLRESYAMIDRNEAWLMNAHISEYSHGNISNHAPIRSRKMLLHRKEIDKLLGATREKGLSLIPIRIYLKHGRVKVEFAIAKGKKMHDKRETERAKTADAEARTAVRNSKARQS
ncbi:MAG: SsrA-binding protein SmpB [Bryobacteraceae bacterium]